MPQFVLVILDIMGMAKYVTGVPWEHMAILAVKQGLASVLRVRLEHINPVLVLQAV